MSSFNKSKLLSFTYIFAVHMWLLFIGIFLKCENIIFRNGSTLNGEIVEISDDGITVSFGRSKNKIKFKWDELNENFAKKLYLKLFKKQSYTENYILGVEIKKFNSNKYIRGLNIKEFSTQDSIIIKTRGKLIKLNRKIIEYIKPIACGIFDVFSEKEIYSKLLRKYFKNGKSIHKLLFNHLRKYNINIFKLHLLLYLISKYPSLPSYNIYKEFNNLLKIAVKKQDMCVLDFLIKKNWFTVSFKQLHETFFYILNKCNYKNYLGEIEQLGEKELIVYSILFSNLLNLYIKSYSNTPLKNLEGTVEKSFERRIDELSISFGKDKKYLNNVWVKRNVNFFKVEVCFIENKREIFFKKWGSLSAKRKYLFFVGSFAKKYLKIVGKSITKKYSNIDCYIYVVK